MHAGTWTRSSGRDNPQGRIGHAIPVAGGLSGPRCKRGCVAPARHICRDSRRTRPGRHRDRRYRKRPPGNAILPAGLRRCWMMFRAANPGSIANSTRSTSRISAKVRGSIFLGLMIKARYFADNRTRWEQQMCLGGFGTLDLPQQIKGRIQATSARGRLGNAAVPAQRFGAQPVSDAVVAGTARRPDSSSVAATSIQGMWATSANRPVPAKRMDSGSTPASTATTTVGTPLWQRLSSLRRSAPIREDTHCHRA